MSNVRTISGRIPRSMSDDRGRFRSRPCAHVCACARCVPATRASSARPRGHVSHDVRSLRLERHTRGGRSWSAPAGGAGPAAGDGEAALSAMAGPPPAGPPPAGPPPLAAEQLDARSVTAPEWAVSKILVIMIIIISLIICIITVNSSNDNNKTNNSNNTTNNNNRRAWTAARRSCSRTRWRPRGRGTPPRGRSDNKHLRLI